MLLYSGTASEKNNPSFLCQETFFQTLCTSIDPRLRFQKNASVSAACCLSLTFILGPQRSKISLYIKQVRSFRKDFAPYQKPDLKKDKPKNPVSIFKFFESALYVIMLASAPSGNCIAARSNSGMLAAGTWGSIQQGSSTCCSARSAVSSMKREATPAEPLCSCMLVAEGRGKMLQQGTRTRPDRDRPSTSRKVLSHCTNEQVKAPSKITCA